jgi:hypothetical protein
MFVVEPSDNNNDDYSVIEKSMNGETKVDNSQK